MDRPAWEKLARLIRYYILTMTTAAESGHMTSSLSAVELATALFYKYFRFDFNDTTNPANDHLIFSKGHASPLYYALYAAAGQLTEKEILSYRTFGSDLEGHPTLRFHFTEAATGSLGQGLGIGAGEAWAHKRQKMASRMWVLLGDGELAEGSVWEAAAFASFHKLNNLVAIVDVNRLGQSQATMYEHHAEVYQRRFDAFGWSTLVINGHDFSEINAAYEKAVAHQDGPVAIIAKTIKGKGVPSIEDKNGWHGKALSKDELTRALRGLGEVDKTFVGKVARPENAVYLEPEASSEKIAEAGIYTKPTSTRVAFGNALVRLGGAYNRILVLDADMQNSTFAELFAEKYHDRFIQCYIAEQNMVSVAVGLNRSGYVPWVTTFAEFFTRAHDQLRMAAIGGADLKICGSHAGVAVGRDGPSQMGLEDISMFRSIHGSTVLSPSDPYQTEKLVEQMQKISGIVYMRTMRDAIPTIYGKNDEFPVGGSKVFDKPKAIVTVVATGVTVHEALKAQKDLGKEHIAVRVIDCYSIKPIDVKTLRKAARETKAIIVAEDHYPEGGLGEAVLSALGEETVPIIHLSVSKMPRSGKPDELLAYEGISVTDIAKEVRDILHSR